MENVRWKTPIPGLAHSSPIVWGDRLFVTTAVSSEANPYLRVGLYGESPDHPEDFVHEFQLYCLDKNTGKILWSRTAYKGKPKVKRHIKSTHANATPATDGKHVVAFFGSEGLYCYDMDGQLVWKRDLGLLDAGPRDAPKLQWSSASSPVIFQNMVIVQCDARNQAFVAAIKLSDGKELWRAARHDAPTWSTPTVHVSEARSQVIVNGYNNITGYDVTTGKQLWVLGGGGDVPVPTPVTANGLIYITSAHGGRAPIYAIKANASGDISLSGNATSNESIAWSYARRGNYMQTPLVYRGLLYCCRDNGAMSCLDASTGRIFYRKRLGTGSTGYTASPVAADGKVYFTSEEGDIHTLQAGPEHRLLATNSMGEICMATPAISEGMIFVRSQHHVFGIGGGSARLDSDRPKR